MSEFQTTDPVFNGRVWAMVRRIPRGKVASYGQIAAWLEQANGARAVGAALRQLPPRSDVPWHRVVNAKWQISLPGHTGAMQRALLEGEGVQFVGNSIGDTIGKAFCLDGPEGLLPISNESKAGER